MDRKTKFDTNSDATDLVGLIQIWKSVKSFDDVAKYGISLGFKEDNLFKGYVYFIDTWLRAFLEEIRITKHVSLKDNYELYRACHRGIPISEISNSCEKIIFIRNFHTFMRQFKKSNSKEELLKHMKKWDDFVSSFSEQLEQSIVETKDDSLTRQDRVYFSTISRGLFQFTQMVGYVPEGRYFSLFRNNNAKNELEYALDGYKITLLYMWKMCLDESQFGFVEGIKNTIDWSDDYFAYKELQKNPDIYKIDRTDFFPESKVEIPGETIDSYFRIILDNIVEPLEKARNIRLTVDAYFLFNKNLSKKIFDSFMNDKLPLLTDEQKINELFLWYPSEVIDSAKRNIFNGATAFMTVMEGAVSLVERLGAKRKIQILKISHEVGKNQHNYSYGVLIESRGSLGSDWSGWMMFFDICGDYSGFSGQEHAYVEQLIDYHLKQRSIELRQQEIPQEKLEAYLSKYSTQREIGQSNNEHKRRGEILNEARGMIVELLVYYLQTQIKDQDVKWGFENKNNGDIDILIEKSDVVKIIECKLDADNCDMDTEIKKIKIKQENYITSKEKSIEFWFWFEPDPNTINRLDYDKIDYHVVSREISTQPDFSKRSEKLKLILDYHDEDIRTPFDDF